MAFLKTTEVELYYTVEGHSGPPVLMIQGVGVAGEGWRPQMNALRRDHTVASFDNRGIGQSHWRRGNISIEAMSYDAEGLLDELGWKSAHVVGHSLGGLIAQQLALSCPERVRSLSLMCTFAEGRQAARLTPWVLWMALRTRLGSRRMRRYSYLEMLLSQAFLKTCDRDQMVATLEAYVGRDLSQQPPILMRQLRAMARHHAYPRLGELATIPTLVVSAEEDPIALPRYGQMLAEAIPGAQFKLLAKLAHAAPIEDPAQTNALLRAFITTSEAQWLKRLAETAPPAATPIE